MSYREFHYRWELSLKANPQALWPLVADTNRFNRETGVPEIQRAEEEARAIENARQRLRFSRFGIGVEWEEQPFEWVRPERFGVVRRYLSGPVAELRVLVELAPRPEGGTNLIYQVWARPRNLLGLAAIPAQIGVISARQFAAAFRRYDQLALQREPPAAAPARRNLAPGGRQRLLAARAHLVRAGVAAELVARLCDLLASADDITLSRLRPYALAARWQVARRATLEMFLLATRAGILDFRWDLLCPLCRGAKRTAASLGEVSSSVHCATCRIDFQVNFDRLVELTFRPNPSVRRVEHKEYCIGGPALSPHIVAQQLLQAGEERKLALPLEPGSYRMRGLRLPGEQQLTIAPEGATEATLRAEDSGWKGEAALLCERPSLHLINATCQEQLLFLERTAWSDDAVTAAEVTALQSFRDLFAAEALRPGEQISVGSLTVVFTDLRDSTRMYREIGDAPAFGAVMSHFDVLREVIAAEEGALIKTIGDAVMAVFLRPVAALRAILSAQAKLAAPPDGMRSLTLKAGVHTGHCIAVTLNDRLDYFGTTINVAARLAAQSQGGDIVISENILRDPETQELLEEMRETFALEPVAAKLKGLENEKLALWRMIRK